MKILVFDIWGEYAHFKKIYATTSALSYVVPPKTSIYGYIGAILGLEKEDNIYLNSFQNKQCLIGISVRSPIVMQRLGINLKAELGRKKEGDPPKPTMMEFVHRPHYRLYVHHSDSTIYDALKLSIMEKRCVFTPTLGLANLVSNFKFVGEYDTEKSISTKTIEIHSVIAKKQFLAFDSSIFEDTEQNFSIVEQSMYALEMDTDRNVTERDDILLERKCNPILAQVKEYYTVNGENIILF